MWYNMHKQSCKLGHLSCVVQYIAVLVRAKSKKQLEHHNIHYIWIQGLGTGRDVIDYRGQTMSYVLLIFRLDQ